MSGTKKIKSVETIPVKGVNKLEDEVVLGGEKIKVTKLKAAKYYKAQKVFLRVIGGFQDSKDSESGKLRAMGDFPEEMIKIIAICLDKTSDEIGELAFPEEVSPAFVIVLNLNRFTENLKNFAAPLESLRGKK